MSQTEHHVGKLIEVKPYAGETVEELMLRLLEENGYGNILEDFYDDIADWFNEDLYDAYYNYNGTIYKIIDKEFEDDDDIITATLEDDNTISYQLRFYNGGASFGECLGEALDKLNKKK